MLAVLMLAATQNAGLIYIRGTCEQLPRKHRRVLWKSLPNSWAGRIATANNVNCACIGRMNKEGHLTTLRRTAKKKKQGRASFPPVCVLLFD